MMTVPLSEYHAQLLTLIADRLSAQGYRMAIHCRLSYECQQNNEQSNEQDSQQNNQPKYPVYQGLTKALYQQQWVMVKWQLAPLNCKLPTALALERANTKLLSQPLLQKKAVTTAQPMLDSHCASVVPLICEQDSSLVLSNLNSLSNNNILSLSESHDTNLSKSQAQSTWSYSSFTMPFVTLGSVKDYLNNNAFKAPPLTYAQKYALIIAIAQCIADLHQAGWIHGDIKPSNILLASRADSDSDGDADSDNNSDSDNDSDSNSDSDSDNTDKRVNNAQTSLPDYTTWLIDLAYAQPIAKIETSLNKEIETMPRGTPAYLAPECWQGQAISVQSDVYAFGIMLYKIIAGKHPYQAINNIASANIANKPADKLRAWATAHCQAAITLIADKAFEDFQPIINKLLAKNRINRYRTMSSILQDLKAVDALKQRQD